MDVLRNPVRRYAWGSHTQIAELLGVPPDGNPQAELWLGAHASAPSRITRDGWSRNLDAVVAADPERELGAAVTAAFGDRLPYLFKVLAVAAPLSLQAHPGCAQAEAGYAAEEGAACRSTPPSAATRTPTTSRSWWWLSPASRRSSASVRRSRPSICSPICAARGWPGSARRCARAPTRQAYGRR